MQSPNDITFSMDTAASVKPHSAMYRRKSLKVPVEHCTEMREVLTHTRSKKVTTQQERYLHRMPSEYKDAGDAFTYDDTIRDCEDDSPRKSQDDDKMKAYKISVVKKLLDEFDLEQTLDSYKCTGRASYSRNPMDYGHDM